MVVYYRGLQLFSTLAMATVCVAHSTAKLLHRKCTCAGVLT